MKKTKIKVSYLCVLILINSYMGTDQTIFAKTTKPYNIGILSLNTKSTKFKTNNKLANNNSISGVYLHSIDNSWASASGLESDTYQGLLDEELKYIENEYGKEKTKFKISDYVSKQETINMDGISYMYTKSSIYKDIISQSEGIYEIASSKWFSKSAGDKVEIYERFPFYIDKIYKLNLNVEHELDKGEMEIWLVSPEGKLKYQSKSNTKFDDTTNLELDKGFWSIIIVYHLDKENKISGSRNIYAEFLLP